MVGEVKMKKTVLVVLMVGLMITSIFSICLSGSAAYTSSSYKVYKTNYGILSRIINYYIHQSAGIIKIEAPTVVKEGADFTVSVYKDNGNTCLLVRARVSFAGKVHYGSIVTFSAPQVDKNSYYYLKAVYRDSLGNYNVAFKRILVLDTTLHMDSIEPAIIQGRVFDSDTYKPIAGVKIVSDTGEFTFSDTQGRYSIKVYIDKARTVHLTAIKKGYLPRTIPVYAEPGKTTRFWNIWLSKRVLVLHKIHIMPPTPPMPPSPHNGGIAKKIEGIIKIITEPHPMSQQGKKIPLFPPDDGGNEGEHGNGWGYVH